MMQAGTTKPHSTNLPRPTSPNIKTNKTSMSASHIPNLNTLRRGGRGRLRGRGGPSTATNAPSKDRVVQATDTDASVSRLSAVNLGYLDDPFARALTTGAEARRLPIINRGMYAIRFPDRQNSPNERYYYLGTYVRSTAIDTLVNHFLNSAAVSNQPTGKKQIISLGAGSDTRVFRLLSSPRSQSPNLVYHEIDFAENTTAKIQAIRSTAALQKALGIQNEDDAAISETGDAFHSAVYHIHPVDLRSLSSIPDTPGPSGQETLQGIDPSLPTLLISECCLVYLSPTHADGVVNFFTKSLFPESTPLGLILYEPIRPDDAFGRTMVSNLAARGIHLQTLQRYATLEAQRGRLREHGFMGGQEARDVDFLWERWVDEQEKERVGGLEMLDEIEEWRLLAGHYCVAWGWRGGGFGGWRE